MFRGKELALGALLGLVACGGVSPEQHEALRKERDALQKQVTELKEQVAKLKKAAKESKQRPTRRSNPRGPLYEANEQTIAEWLERAKISKDSKLQATIQTSLGDIHCELFPDKAPMTVANFVGLAEGTFEWRDPKTGEMVRGKPLYDGVIFHRVIPNFMIQGGDPQGTGRGGPGYRFDDETNNGLTFDQVGLLAMANAGPKTNGSQFFITVRKTPHLNGKHTIFGKCDLDTVQKIVTTPATRTRPDEDVVIRHIAIERN